MSVYMIVDISVHDERVYAMYATKAQKIVEEHSGEYLVRGGNIAVRSGEWDPERLVIVKFPSLDKMRTCFKSPEYALIAPLRRQSANANVVVVEGIPES